MPENADFGLKPVSADLSTRFQTPLASISPLHCTNSNRWFYFSVSSYVLIAAPFFSLAPHSTGGCGRGGDEEIFPVRPAVARGVPSGRHEGVQWHRITRDGR